jgi:hypothetical protein
LAAGDADCETMKHALQVVIAVEKVFSVLEVVSEGTKVGLPATWNDVIGKSLVEDFANFIIGLRIYETAHNRLRSVMSYVCNAASLNRR